MFSFFKRKPKEDWRLVKTIKIGIIHNTSKKEGKLYYHLFESNLGNRRTRFACTFPEVDAEIMGKKFEDYHEKVYRWEMGRVDPEIPTYNQVPEEEISNILKGKVD